ncbi:glutamine--fructose-6-phosphate transaminase (isomerizing) [Entomobacter blattae]|uniref:Glutamine--fructose-6-phosphate aminotransferase [isomerizing] n=1 Tax=Entomobacter blattae TaxID=2762277 RepID=A0A7H1NT00_9PROT|nr:glutamine--fructose-6-phosphate transaminase (isomerizing) [Entomobacter blattae]QNT78910.1 Glutamine--fructose-6-phosphate aminotransferase [Entomobacter blattae]
MCGIVAAISQTPVTQIIFEALRRLEYRGYDSAGIATLVTDRIERRRVAGKLDNLEKLLKEKPLPGHTGIGHTRWATHGAPTEINAHPHMTDKVCIVHNGIIENYEELRTELTEAGQIFRTDTDSEAVVQLLDYYLTQGKTPLQAAIATLQRLRGAYALAMIFAGYDNMVIGARHGAPLVIGYGEKEMFLGSDSLALAPLTQKISYLEDGDCVVMTQHDATIYTMDGNPVEREIKTTALAAGSIGKDGYRHYMEKELHEHPVVVGQTLQRFIDPTTHRIVPLNLPFDLSSIHRVSISACGSAFYAGLIGRYWIENYARIPVDIDVASELRYRNPPMEKGGLGILVSQSGETADTLAALKTFRENEQHIVSIVNVDQSSIARQSDYVFGTVAGPEISVASTKAFSAQLSVLACLAIALARAHNKIDPLQEEEMVNHLLELPSKISQIFVKKKEIQQMAEFVADAKTVLYLGRGSFFPLALEGALKLKEISYIHAEAYAAGEMKHGPIALIDQTVPVIAIAPSGPQFDKIASNLQEAKARGGRLLVFTDQAGAERLQTVAEQCIILPEVDAFVAPIIYTVPIQYLAYEVAIKKGTDVDQPRNLAKSVTVE